MAWTTPASYSVGEIVTASKLNLHIRDNLRYLKGLDGAVVFDNSITAQNVNVVGTSGTSDVIVELGAGVTTSRNVYIDFISDATYTNYGLRVWRPAGGANVDSELIHRGTGALRLHAWDTGRVELKTGASPGAFVTWSTSGLSTTPQTVIPSGVNRRVHGFITAWHSGGTGGGTQFGLGTGVPIAVYNDGVNVVSILVSSGAMTIFRSAGSGTFDVTLAFTYQ